MRTLSLSLFLVEALACFAFARAATGLFDPNRVLLSAAKDNDSYQAQWLLGKGADVNFKDENGNTPLYLAIIHNSFEVAKLLLDNGADKEAKGQLDRTPLHFAVMHNRSDIVTALLERKANVNALCKSTVHIGRINLPYHLKPHRCTDGLTPLHHAAQDILSPIVEKLLIGGAAVNATDEYKMTPLHYALESLRADVATVLMRYGADLEAMDISNRTPLQIAYRRLPDDKLDAFLKQSIYKDDNVDRQLRTPLHYAAEKGDLEEVLEILFDCVSARDSGERVPLHLNVNARDWCGQTPLHFAARNNHPEVVFVLLASGADIHVVDEYGGTPLHHTCQQKSTSAEVVKVLLESGANINALNCDGNTPLFAAIYGGHLQAIDALLEGGASLNVTDGNGYFPLHAAAIHDDSEVLEELIKRSIDFLETKDRNGWTPLHCAVMSGHSENVKVLLKYKANVHALDDDVLTQLKHVTEAKKIEIRSILNAKHPNS